MRSGYTNRSQRALRWVVLLVSLLLSGLLLLGGTRLARNWRSSHRVAAASDTERVALYLVCGDCPFVYTFNTRHPSVNRQGLRGPLHGVPKPPGVLRLLALGDSVVAADDVERSGKFTTLLEERLTSRFGRSEVINTGISGYSPYTELQYYRTVGYRFEPDLVLAFFTMNDVANPRLHWGAAMQAIDQIPEEAIPNRAYDSKVIRPAMRNDESLRDYIENAHRRNMRGAPDAHGDRWPEYITGEDSLSIRILLDYDSPEWRWLRSMYGQLDRATRTSNARLAIIWIPLAYQLREGYPLLPQTLFRRYCARTGIPCLDLLDVLRESASPLERTGRGSSDGSVFRGRDGDYDDIWHLSARGHQLVAEELERFLLPLLPAAPAVAGPRGSG